MSDKHVLTFWIDREADNPLHLDGTLTVHMQCPYIDDACRIWKPCDAEGCDPDELERLQFDEGIDGPFLHGQRHQNIDGEYMLPTDTCFMLSDTEAVYDTAEIMIEAEQLAPGAYLVGHRFFDGGLDEFTLVEPRAGG